MSEKTRNTTGLIIAPEDIVGNETFQKVFSGETFLEYILGKPWKRRLCRASFC
jgi:hypothetical protein